MGLVWVRAASKTVVLVLFVLEVFINSITSTITWATTVRTSKPSNSHVLYMCAVCGYLYPYYLNKNFKLQTWNYATAFVWNKKNKQATTRGIVILSSFWWSTATIQQKNTSISKSSSEAIKRKKSTDDEIPLMCGWAGGDKFNLWNFCKMWQCVIQGCTGQSF